MLLLAASLPDLALSLVLIIGMVCYGLTLLGVLPAPGRTAQRLKLDLDVSERELARKTTELDHAQRTVKTLEQTRSMEPVLVQLERNAGLQEAVLERLAHHNGSFKEIHDSLHAVTVLLGTLLDRTDAAAKASTSA